MKKENKYIDENLIYILNNTTPYQRLLWLKKAVEFWKIFETRRRNRNSKKYSLLKSRL